MQEGARKDKQLQLLIEILSSRTLLHFLILPAFLLQPQAALSFGSKGRRGVLFGVVSLE
jgi:hypothetical protein